METTQWDDLGKGYSKMPGRKLAPEVSSGNWVAATFCHIRCNPYFSLLLFNLFYNLKYASQSSRSHPRWLSKFARNMGAFSQLWSCPLQQDLWITGSSQQVQTEAKKPKPCQMLCFCKTNVSRCPEGEVLHPYQSSLYAKSVSPEELHPPLPSSVGAAYNISLTMRRICLYLNLVNLSSMEL